MLNVLFAIFIIHNIKRQNLTKKDKIIQNEKNISTKSWKETQEARIPF